MCPDEISISLSCLEFAELHGSVGKPLHQMREFLNDRSHRCFFCLFLLLSPLWNFSYIHTGTLRWGRRPLRLCAFLLSPLFYRGTNGWWPIFKSPEHSFHLQSAAESIHWIFFNFTYHTSLCSMVTAHTFYSPLEVLYPLLCGGHCLPLNIFITGFFSVKSISGSTQSKFLLTPFFPEKMYYCPASLKMYAFSSENWVFKYYVRVILIFIGVFWGFFHCYCLSNLHLLCLIET